MKKLVLHAALACLVLFALQVHSVQAQFNCPDPDLVAVVFDNGDINAQTPVYDQLTATIYLVNPTESCILGFELNLQFPSQLINLGTEFPVEAIDFGYNSEFLVQFSEPVCQVNGMIELCTVRFLLTGPDQADIFLAPVENSPSIPGHMAYLKTDETFEIMDPISGNYSLPVSSVNGIQNLIYCDGTSTPDMTVQISALGDNNNIAGTAPDALDEYDSLYDQVDTDPNRIVSFPHQEWNHPDGDDFRHDVKTAYDPLTEIKQWTFVVDVEVDNSGSSSVDVDLVFGPSFDSSSGIAMHLFSEYENQSMELQPPYIHSFTAYNSGEYSFDLYIGTQEIADDLELIVDVSHDQLNDNGNLAATSADATDGYDAGLDIPEPIHPPANYLAGSFHHSDWPMGTRYKTDVRAVYDPLEEVKTWPFRVETDQSGSIVLDFSPNFDQSSQYTLSLKDMNSGQSYNLFPGLSYSYLNNGETVRDFEISIGAGSQIPPLSPESRYLQAGWSMVGFPLEPLPGLNTLGSVILDQAPGYSYAFLYEGNQGYAMQEEDNTIVPGSGYWIATDNAFVWTMNGNINPDPVYIDLQPGWNLVSNPLWFPAPVEGLRVQYNGFIYSWYDAVSMGLLNSAVMHYNTANDYYFDTDDLEAWRGYWFGAEAAGVTLVFDWPNFQVLPPRFSTPPVLDAPSTVSWRTDFISRNSDDKACLVTFGMNSEATAGCDPWLDLPQAPASPAGGPRLGILHPEWNMSCGSRYSTDFIQPTKDPVFWNIEIKNEQAGEVNLSWTKFDWPADLDFQLYIPSQNRVVVRSMREEESIQLAVGSAGLVVQVRTPDLMSGVADLPGMPYRLSVSPNPFNPQTTILFNLAEPGDVELKIYNIRGERIKSLAADGLTAGQHEMVWRGRDHTGKAVPSGSYFIKMYRNGQPVGTVIKMSLVR